MTQFHKFLVFLGGAVFITATALAVDRTDTDNHLHYFRSDLGIAPSGTGPLPDNFDTPGTLRWRVAVDSGQSTPILCAGKIFLTTYRSDAKELATVALDQKTGELLWKRPVPVASIETFHPQTGNAAVATPACDGTRLYVFFGSYGLICYRLEGEKVWEQR